MYNRYFTFKSLQPSFPLVLSCCPLGLTDKVSEGTVEGGVEVP